MSQHAARVLGGIAVAFAATCCGGAEFSTEGTGGIASGGTSGAGGESASGGAGGAAGSVTGGTSAGGTDAGAGGSGGCVTKTWCFDGDGDGFGAGTTQSACEAPGQQWIDVASKPNACDDCSDDNGDVFPGSQVCSAQSYATPSSGLSYDFDCDGNAVPCEPLQKAGKCAMSAGSCTGSGYLEQVSGSYCGSAQYQKCEVAIPYTSCKTTVSTATAVTCK